MPNLLAMKKGRPRCRAKLPTAQDVFGPISGPCLSLFPVHSNCHTCLGMRLSYLHNTSCPFLCTLALDQLLCVLFSSPRCHGLGLCLHPYFNRQQEHERTIFNCFNHCTCMKAMSQSNTNLLPFKELALRHLKPRM